MWLSSSSTSFLAGRRRAPMAFFRSLQSERHIAVAPGSDGVESLPRVAPVLKHHSLTTLLSLRGSREERSLLVLFLASLVLLNPWIRAAASASYASVPA